VARRDKTLPCIETLVDVARRGETLLVASNTLFRRGFPFLVTKTPTKPAHDTRRGLPLLVLLFSTATTQGGVTPLLLVFFFSTAMTSPRVLFFSTAVTHSSSPSFQQ